MGLKSQLPDPARIPLHSFSRLDWLLLLMTLIWGTNYPLVKSVFRELDPQAFNALRLVIASCVLVATSRMAARAHALDDRLDAPIRVDVVLAGVDQQTRRGAGPSCAQPALRGTLGAAPRCGRVGCSPRLA